MLAPVSISMPRFSIAFCSRYAAFGSSWRSIRVGMRCTTVVFMPFIARPAAASRPSRPPPITTALPPLPAAASMASTSSRSRKVTTPGRSTPGTGIRIGLRADRDHQGVIALALASIGADGLRGAVDGDDRLAPAQVDAVAFVPGVVMDDDVLELLFAGQHRRQHDAVIVDARLGAEDGDVVAAWGSREQLLEQAAGRHAVAENDEPPPVRTCCLRHLLSRTPIVSDRKQGLARLCSDGSTARTDIPRERSVGRSLIHDRHWSQRFRWVSAVVGLRIFLQSACQSRRLGLPSLVGVTGW